MGFTRVFKWNGVSLKYPTSFTYNKSKLQTDESGRSPLTGIMIKTEIGKTRNISMKWDRLTEDECYDLSCAFDDDEGQITFADPCAGKKQDTTWKAYTGDFSAEYLYSNQDDEFRYSVSLDFIEIDCNK
jgi:hypothetical protein